MFRKTILVAALASLFSIGASAAVSPEGAKELLKRYPTMRIDVYPTHRTAAVPKFVLENTAKNATAAKTSDGGITLESAVAGYPFPIPKTGYEVMWNHLMHYKGLGWNA